MTSIDEIKKEMRKNAAQRRKSAFDAMPDAATKIARFADQIWHAFSPSVIAAFWPIRTEIDPVPLLETLCARGADGCLPVTPEEGKPLIFHQWRVGESLCDGPYQTKQPDNSAPVMRPDLILAPLLAFDSDFWRLGYGGGFYDRTLAGFEAEGHHAVVIGIAFDESEVETVPTGPYDKALSGILTPSGLRLAPHKAGQGA